MFGFKPKHTIEKLVASNAPEIIDPNLIAEVFNVWNQHDKELTDVWRLMNPQSREELVSVFLKELEKEFRREFSELNSENVMTIMMEDLKTSIKGAFAAGYMTGKGWISLDHLSNFNLCIGDKVAKQVRLAKKGAKSKGVAFASALSCVSVNGHLAALTDNSE